jgi:hypothetical protein
LTRLLEFFEWNHDYLRSLESKTTALCRTAEQDRLVVGKLVDDLLEESKKLLMLPLATLGVLFPKVVRDLCRDQGKEADDCPGLEDLLEEPEVERLGRGVHDEQDADPDDEADRPRPPDEAEQPVDQEGGDSDVDQRRQPYLLEDRLDELRHRAASVASGHRRTASWRRSRAPSTGV